MSLRKRFWKNKHSYNCFSNSFLCIRFLTYCNCTFFRGYLLSRIAYFKQVLILFYQRVVRLIPVCYWFWSDYDVKFSSFPRKLMWRHETRRPSLMTLPRKNPFRLEIIFTAGRQVLGNDRCRQALSATIAEGIN